MRHKPIAGVVGVLAAAVALVPAAPAATDLGGVNVLKWCQNQQLGSNAVSVDAELRLYPGCGPTHGTATGD